jgi:flavin-dependent dehydrogenase
MDSSATTRQAAEQWFEGARLQTRRKSFHRSNGGAESPAPSKLFPRVETFREVDVLVVGAGPAGATAALNLAPTRTVVLVDRESHPRPRIGESLPPAARRLFTDMGLWESFQSQGHSPCYGNRAVWGSPQAFETDFLRDPDGHGWHIDRARFDMWLRGIAVDRGAMLLAPGLLNSIEWDGQKWRARVGTVEGFVDLIARVVIDAGGRANPVAGSLGARRKLGDKLVCSWVSGKARPIRRGAGFTYVEATEDGWWYSAPLPDNRRVLAFHTDSDLPTARSVADPKRLLELASVNRELGAVLSESGFSREQSGFAAAHSAILQPLAGPAWFAVGDAACSFDPLSSQGLLNALFTGLAAAEAADRHLSGAANVQSEYLQTVNQVYITYQQHLIRWYGSETRWSDQSFWRRRHGIDQNTH